MEQIANFIRKKRKELNLTQEEFAKKVGVGLRFLRELEAGKETVRFDKVMEVLKFLGYDLAPQFKGKALEDESNQMKMLPISKFRTRMPFLYGSSYITLKDGIKIAVDVFLPKNHPAKKFPALINFVRYVRTIEFKKPFHVLSDPGFGHVKKKEVKHFTSNGYAVVIVDLRGSGASTGFRDMEFGKAEIEDMYEVMDWIIAQEWSNNKLATMGVSYTGTTAEFALSTKHPSLKAAVVRSGIYDLYSDVCFPGGIRQSHFIDIWKKTVDALDRGDFSIFGLTAKLLVKGPKSVEVDGGVMQLSMATEEHSKNYDFLTCLHEINHRNEKLTNLPYTSDDFSVHTKTKTIIESDIPILRMTGWYDAGFLESACKAFRNVPNTQKLIIGPWDHGPWENISPFSRGTKLRFEVYKEMQRFFDHYLMNKPKVDIKEKKVHFYTLGKEKYHKSETWPPQEVETETLYLSDKILSDTKSKSKAFSAYKCNYKVSSGKSVRWNSATDIYRNGPIRYDNRYQRTRQLLNFISEPLKKGIEITGQNVVELYVSADYHDFNLFVYLDDIGPRGRQATYITEGLLRVIHRKELTKKEALYDYAGPVRRFYEEDVEEYTPGEIVKVTIPFYSISYYLKRGHRLQLSVGVADCDHFDSSYSKAKVLQVHYGPGQNSKLKLSTFNLK